jgi:sulfhydrogenase subunit beta (sulfur reductase)
MRPRPVFILPKARMDELIRLLAGDGFEVVGPRIDQDAIVYGPVRAASDLPIGWTDRQEPGSYRLEKRGDKAYFGYAVGPHSWKKYLFPASLALWNARRTESGFEVKDASVQAPRRAFLGVRACELQAIAVQDHVFIDRAGQITDPYYAQARANLFLIAVECEHPGGTCFCASMGTGPEISMDGSQPSNRKRIARSEPMTRADAGRLELPMTAPSAPVERASSPPCDLALTELDESFVVQSGTAAGNKVIDRLGLAEAEATQWDESRQRVAAAARSMGRTLDTSDIHGLLHANQEHPRWEDVAQRCLACTNCTMVCPTCFCSTTEEVSDLLGNNVEHTRRWDSCFTPEFARVHGGNFRPSTRGRYRQWLTHKFASWFDQFDESGCVGCGRCITWCPVGIDVTVELAAIRQTAGAGAEGSR